MISFFATSYIYWSTVVLVSIAKLLLINSYRSTDFEVHRNWLAITYSLPVEKWYYEDTSEWTLDYPPFFAYFEWSLAQVAQYFDADMLQVGNLNHASFNTILFQKLSVIFADFLLAFAIIKCCQNSSALFQSSSPRKRESSKRISLECLFVLIFLNAGLFIVDHIHFQYNGFLFGILLLSISKCLEGKHYQSAFIFAALVNFKHIFLYVAPAYGVYLVRLKCFPRNTPFNIKNVITSISGFGAIGVGVLVASFGPFYQHIPQILKRLFPFQRGLSHAYWAPNIWAAYNTLDWVCNLVLKKGKSAVTSGLVGEATLTVLPQVLPLHTFILTVTFMLPALYQIWQSPTEGNFLRGIIVTGWTSYMFGYHVHEKAILNVLIPFSLVAFQDANLFFLTLVTGTVSLFPLLFTPIEVVLKAVIAILHFSLTLQLIPVAKLKTVELIYLGGFIFVYLFENLGPALLPQFPFLPLMFVSNYCFLGMVYCYAILYWRFVTPTSGIRKQVMSPRTTKVVTSSEVKSDVIQWITKKVSAEVKSDVIPRVTKVSPEVKSRVTPRSSKKVSPEVPPSTRVLRKRTK